MRIEVKKKHIRAAWKNREFVSCTNCPVALALHDAGFDGVEVYNDGKIHIPNKRVRKNKAVTKFVEGFDFDRFEDLPTTSAQPFEFELEVIS